MNISYGALTYMADNEVPQEWREPELADRSRPIITACEVGPLGALAGKLLQDMGFTNVSILEGGTQAWKDAGFPTQQEAAAQQMAEEEQFVEAAMANENAFQSGDVDRIIEFYAEDAVSMPPGFPVSAGKEAIEADLRFFFDEFDLEREFTLVDYEVTGEYATRSGEWTQTLTPKAGGDPVVETGRCLLGFKKVGDEWKVAWEIWNTYEPPAAD
jgi:ketosteroid isomerase-like protein